MEEKKNPGKNAIMRAIKLLQDIGYEVIPPEPNKESIIKDTFNDFWEKYGKKVDKERTFKHWKRMNKSERDKAVAFIPTYLASVKDKQYQKYPLTYLNARLWEDGNDYIASAQETQKAQIQEQASTISMQIEQLKQKKLSEQIDLKREMEASRFRDMISIYEKNNRSLCAKPLIEAYKDGTLKELGITWHPKDTTSKIH